MICKKCNTVIPDDSKFCPNCRTKVEDESVEIKSINSSTEQTKATLERIKSSNRPIVRSTNSESKSILDIIEIIAGAVLIVAGVVFFCISSPGIEEASFGADFYTFTYDGIYAIANLIGILIKAISVSMIAIGAVIECHSFGKKKVGTINANNSNTESDFIASIEKDLPQM